MGNVGVLEYFSPKTRFLKEKDNEFFKYRMWFVAFMLEFSLQVLDHVKIPTVEELLGNLP